METSQKTLIFGFAGLLMLILIVFFFMWRKKNKAATPAPNPDPNVTLQAQLQAQMQTQQAILQAQKTQEQRIEAQIQAQKDAQALAQLQAQQTQVQPATNEEFPLKVGSYGLRVKKLQTFLAKKYGWGGKIDGKLGTQTMQALKDKFKLTTDDFSATKYELFNIEEVVVAP